MPEDKRCSKCRQVKLLTKFHRHAASKDGLRPRCKECRQEDTRIYYEENREAKRERDRKYYEANREKVRATNRAWWEANLEHYRNQKREYYQRNREETIERARANYAENKERALAWTSAYRRTPKGKEVHLQSQRKRRATKAQLEATLTAEEWNEILNLFGHRCAYCGERVEEITMDHVVPISRGGPHTRDNVVPACRPCNSRKHNNTPQEAGMEVVR